MLDLIDVLLILSLSLCVVEKMLKFICIFDVKIYQINMQNIHSYVDLFVQLVADGKNLFEISLSTFGDGEITPITFNK